MINLEQVALATHNLRLWVNTKILYKNISFPRTEYILICFIFKYIFPYNIIYYLKMNIIKQEFLTFKKKHIDVTNELFTFDVNLSQYRLNICNPDKISNFLIKLKEQKYCTIIKEKLKLFLLEPYSLFAKFKKFIFDKLCANADIMILDINKYEIKPFRNDDYEIHYSCINDTSYKFVYNLIKKFYNSFDLYNAQVINDNIEDRDYYIFKKIFGDNNVRNELIHCIADLNILHEFNENLNTYTFKLIFNGSIIDSTINLYNIINAIYNFSQTKYLQFIEFNDNFEQIMNIIKQYDNKDFFCFRFDGNLNKMQKFYFNICCEYEDDDVDNIQNYSKYKVKVDKNLCEKINNIHPILLYFANPSIKNSYDFLYNGVKKIDELLNISNLKEFFSIINNCVSGCYYRYYNNVDMVDVDDTILNVIKEIELLQYVPSFTSNHTFIKNMYNTWTIADYYKKTKNVDDILYIYYNYNNTDKSLGPLLEIYVDSQSIHVGNLIQHLIKLDVIYFYFSESVLESFEYVRPYMILISKKCSQLKNDNNANDFVQIVNIINNLQYRHKFRHLYDELKQMFYVLF
jgi:hypothetical protein